MSFALLSLLFTVFCVLSNLWKIGIVLHKYWQSPRTDQDAQKLRQELLSLLWECVRSLVLRLFTNHLDLVLEAMNQVGEGLIVLLE